MRLSQAEDRPYIEVQSSNANTTLETLIDTGSYVNLMRESIYKKHYSNKKLFHVSDNIKLQGVNNSVIKILGKGCDQIKLKRVSNWFDLDFLVVGDGTMKFDCWEDNFFQNSNITLIYHNGNYKFEKNKESEEFVHSIFNIDVIETLNIRDKICENLNPEIPFALKNKLLETFKTVDNFKIEPIKDDYCAKVYLKDDSLFRFASRRMSVNEKKELDVIIDDLLSQNIIKPSISLYCARVLLVPKRDGKKRMCVDLRPSNQHIYP